MMKRWAKGNAPFDPMELDLNSIIRRRLDTKVVLVRVLILVVAIVVGILIFDYYTTENAHLVKFISSYWSDNDDENVETVFDNEGHLKRQVIFQVPKRFDSESDREWKKKFWQEQAQGKS
uniref:Uncharacterized protein n=1 Tax=Spongospora subterranea TaxID=70186 RepID=A0A0H5RCB6_9EUKA|eukprot:CRZ11875.1 hypothetical protein [Spongospora subterranea]